MTPGLEGFVREVGNDDEHEKRIEAGIQEYVYDVCGYTTVNWSGVCEIGRQKSPHDVDLYVRIINHLLRVNILSSDPDGNYLLVNQDITPSSLNLRRHEFPLYFVRSNDIQQYERAICVNGQPPVLINGIHIVK